MANTKEGRARLHITLSQEIAERIEQEALKSGLAASTYIQMVMAQHFKQTDTLAQMHGLDKILDKMMELQKNENEKGDK